MTDGPLIVQSDKTVLLEVDHEQSGAARAAIAPFAELERYARRLVDGILARLAAAQF